MKERTIGEEIEIIVDDKISQIPQPTRCTITKVYEDNKHIDAETEAGIIKYAETIGTPIPGNNGVIIFLGSLDDYIVIV